MKIRNILCGLCLLLLMLSSLTVDGKTYVFKTELPSGALPIRLELDGNLYWITSTSQKVEIDFYGNLNYYCEDAYGQPLRIETAAMDDGTTNAYIGGIMPSWANHGKRRKYGYENGQVIDYTNGNETAGAAVSPGYSQDGGAGEDNYYTRKYGDPDHVGDRVRTAGKAVMGGLAGVATSGGSQLLLRGAFGRAWGTFGRVEGRFGSSVALAVYGGLGKDLVWKLDNKDKLSWHAGLGVVFALDEDVQNCASDINVGLTYGETPAYENKALLLELGFDHFFGKSRRFGLFGSAGFGLGNFNEDIKDWFFDNRHYVWDVTAGIAIRLF